MTISSTSPTAHGLFSSVLQDIRQARRTRIKQPYLFRSLHQHRLRILYRCQTAALLKKHVCRIERFELSFFFFSSQIFLVHRGEVELSTRCALYSSLSDQAPVEDSTRLALRRISGPGVSEVDPAVLVVDVSDAEKRSK